MGDFVAFLWVAAVVCGILAMGAVNQAFRKSRPYREVTVLWRVVASVVALALTAGGITAGAFANKLNADEKIRVAKQREQAIKFLRPVAEELDRLNFKAPAGHGLNDPELYEFEGDTFNFGKVAVANKHGDTIWIKFEISTTSAQVGCFDEVFLPATPYGAKLLRATDRGCST